MKTMLVKEEVLPVVDDVDVLVIGGGPAGLAAAFAAARAGASVLIIEQFNCLGGVAGAGGHGHISIYCAWGLQNRIVGGIADEIASRLVDDGVAHRTPHGVWFEVEGLKFLLDRMIKETGTKILYYTQFSSSIVEEGKITGAIIQNKAGRQVIKAKRVVDCTGDGDVAASAGAPFDFGRPNDHKCQPVTLMFTIGGVDWQQLSKFQEGNYHLKNIWKLAQDNGDMEPFQSTIMGFWHTPSRPDQVGINFTHITNIDSTKATDLTYATMEGRRQAYQSIDVFRKYVKGMENCYMISTPNTVGIRESRRIIGDLILTEEDLKSEREWVDSIGYGSFFIDIHHIDGAGMDKTTFHPEPGFKYQIPYRVLVPQKIENLLVAGRCISCTHVALGSLRVMVQCMLTGEAAGIAAWQSIQQNVTPGKIDVPTLQKALREKGGILNEDDIAKYN